MFLFCECAPTPAINTNTKQVHPDHKNTKKAAHKAAERARAAIQREGRYHRRAGRKKAATFAGSKHASFHLPALPGDHGGENSTPK